MRRSQLLATVARFCAKPFAQHGAKGSDGWYPHDWGHLVLDLSAQLFDMRPAREVAWTIANQVRTVYPNGPDWNARVNGPGAHDQILDLIAARLEGWRRQSQRPVAPDNATDAGAGPEQGPAGDKGESV